MSEWVAKVIADYAFGEARVRFERPVRIKPVLPDQDSIDTFDAGDFDMPEPQGLAPALDQTEIDAASKLIGLRVGIVYDDAEGAQSTREITIRSLRLSADGSSLGLQCICHARKAARLFRLDRIRRVFDVETGEAFENFPDYLATLAGLPGGEDVSAAARVAAAISAVKTELQVLVFVARSDGWHPSETVVACNFVIDAPTTPRDIDIDELERQVRRLDPDKLVFRRALGGFQRSGKGNVERLYRAMRRLVDADGVLSPEEFDFIQELGAALEGRGA